MPINCNSCQTIPFLKAPVRNLWLSLARRLPCQENISHQSANSLSMLGGSHCSQTVSLTSDGHDFQLLLSNEDTRIGFLASKLQGDFPEHVIKPQIVSVSDVINIPQIKSVSESILLEYADHEIDIYFSPGTSAMQVAWYSCHVTLGLKTRLLQVRPPRSRSGRSAGDSSEPLGSAPDHSAPRKTHR